MLTKYLQQVQRLLHNGTGTLYSQTDLTDYINEARMQIAMEAQCVRATNSFVSSAGTNNFLLSSLTFSAGTGIASAIELRSLLANGSWIQPRNWEWYTLHYLANPQTAALPSNWSQFGDGSSGQIYFWPTPTLNLTLTLDVACFPIDLVDDSTIEAIPYPYQQAVKYYAAYLAFLGIMRNADADNMRGIFSRKLGEARMMTRPTVLPNNSNTDWTALDRSNAQ